MLDDKLQNENSTAEKESNPIDENQESLIPEPEKESFWKKYQEVVVTLVILVAIAFGFYFYAKKSKPAEEAEKENTSSVQELNIEEIGAIDEGEKTNKAELEEDLTEEEAESKAEVEPTETIQPKDSQKDVVTQTPAPIAEKTENSFVESAQKGEGVTHLARRALQTYLNDKGGDVEITNEHKIYIEDYLKNKTSSKLLNLEEKVSFSFALIDEAIASAKTLNQNQLKNLEKYSQVVF